MKKKAKKTHKHGLGCLWGHVLDFKNWALNSDHLASLVLIAWGGGLVLKCFDPWALTGLLAVLLGMRRLLK
jgi:hypothetical protein